MLLRELRADDALLFCLDNNNNNIIIIKIKSDITIGGENLRDQKLAGSYPKTMYN